MESIDKIKVGFTVAFGAISAWLGILTWPVMILVGFNIADYSTGLYAAHIRGEQVTSGRGMHGIVKKVCMWLLVAVGAGVDKLLVVAATAVGIQSPLNFFVASLVAIWLICNEAISILENISDIGVSGPPVLLDIIKWIKAQAEDKGKLQTDKEDSRNE